MVVVGWVGYFRFRRVWLLRKLGAGLPCSDASSAGQFWPASQDALQYRLSPWVYILVTNVGQHSTQSCRWCGSRSIIEAECCDWVLPSIGHRGHKVIFLLSFPLHCANPASILTESKKDKINVQKTIKKWGERKNRAASIVWVGGIVILTTPSKEPGIGELHSF